MHRLPVDFSLESHVLIDAGTGDENMVATCESLPATTLIGSLALVYMRRNGLSSQRAHLDPDFGCFFLGRALRFLNAYITKGAEGRRSLPAPAGLFHAKNQAHGDYANRLFGPAPDGIAERAAAGWMVFEGDGLRNLTVKKRIHMHHQQEADRRVGRSASGIIFNYETLMPGQVFRGEVRGGRDALSRFADVFRQTREIAIGRSRMTEYGRVAMRLGDITPVPAPEAGGRSLTLTCLSPMIVCNANGFSQPTADNLGIELARRLAMEPDEVCVEQIFGRTVRVENHVGVWNLRRFTEYAFDAGTTLRLTLAREPDSHLLHRLSAQGAGLRRHEGFGELAVGFPGRQAYCYAEAHTRPSPGASAPPGGTIPVPVAEMLRRACRERLSEAARVKALEDAAEFRLPSLSVIGRLEGFLSRGALAFADCLKTHLFSATGTPKRAAVTLKRCHRGGRGPSLWDHLTTAPTLPEDSAVKALMADNAYAGSGLAAEMETDGVREAVHREYWLTFLRALRKQSRRDRKEVRP